MAKKPVQAIDWQTIANDLQAIASGLPAFAAVVLELIAAFKGTPMQAGPRCPCPDELRTCIEKHLEGERKALMSVLCCNMQLQKQLDECPAS